MCLRSVYIPILCLLGFSACQPEGAAAPVKSISTVVTQIKPISIADLPTALSDTQRKAFADSPRQTAMRFMAAYDDFSESGPVTQQRVQDLARLRGAFERSQLLGHIFAMDINGDTHITKTEVNLALTLPGWSNKPALIEDLFDSDTDQNGIISVQEAIHYSRDLHTRMVATADLPIGSFLMLSDLDKDGIVTRDEMANYLLEFLAKS